jgi:ABC-type sugar transport system permease subunit
LTFRIIFGLRLFGPIYLFNGGGPVSATKVLSILLYEEGIVYWHFGLGSAVAVMLLIVTLLLAAPQIKAMQQAMFRS